MINIQPITLLRDTDKLEKDLKKKKTPIFITKNGYTSFVILSPDEYEEMSGRHNEPLPRTFDTAEKEIETRVSCKQSNPLGFVRVRAASLNIKVADINHNAQEIKNAIKDAYLDGVKILALPELCLTGYTCGDLFLSEHIKDEVQNAILEIEEYSKEFDVFVSFGAPLQKANRLFNCAINIYKGTILGVTPKSFIPNYSEFYEARHFTPAPESNSLIEIGGKSYPFGKKLIYVDENYLKLRIGVEICEDLWVVNNPSDNLSLAGANVIINLSASNEMIGKDSYRRDLVRMTSGKQCSAYIYSDAGQGESSTDLVFSGHNIIAENGKILAESPLFRNKPATIEIDIEKLLQDRNRLTTFENKELDQYRSIYFRMPIRVPDFMLRKYEMNPFIPNNTLDLEKAKMIIRLQSRGLATRLKAINCNKVIIGLSGGLDSTLALLVAVETFKEENIPLSNIICVSMPAFGTTKRTKTNAEKLANALGVDFREIDLSRSLLSHFDDLRHDINNRNLTFENSQARERTQLLMDMCGDENAIMVGTGDLSELCLGWTTYNGDHMSMYGVNASVPKTMVRYLIKCYSTDHQEISKWLDDILDTPISPELLPADKAGNIVQMTEDSVGPYELNDFFIYHFLRYGFSPKKIFFLANLAYKGKYDEEFIKKWLKQFFRRFFNNQFKRSCLPDGPKIGSVSISPRGDWRMPSDASSTTFLKEIDEL